MLPDQHQRCSDSKMNRLLFITIFCSFGLGQQLSLPVNVKCKMSSAAEAWLGTFGFGAEPKLFSSAILEPMERKDWPSESSWFSSTEGFGGEWTNWMKMIGFKTWTAFNGFGNRRSIYSWPTHNGVLRLLNYFLFGSRMATVIQKLPGFCWCWFLPPLPHSFTWNWLAASTPVPPGCVIKFQRPPIPPGNLNARHFMLWVLLFDSSHSWNLQNPNKT